MRSLPVPWLGPHHRAQRRSSPSSSPGTDDRFMVDIIQGNSVNGEYLAHQISKERKELGKATSVEDRAHQSAGKQLIINDSPVRGKRNSHGRTVLGRGIGAEQIGHIASRSCFGMSILEVLVCERDIELTSAGQLSRIDQPPKDTLKQSLPYAYLPPPPTYPPSFQQILLPIPTPSRQAQTPARSSTSLSCPAG